MKKLLLAFAISFALLFSFSGLASARDMTGHFGVGVDAPIMGYRGVAGTYYFNKWFGLQGLLGIDVSSWTRDEAPKTKVTATDWYLGLRGIVPFQIHEDVNLGAFVGLNFHGISLNSSVSGSSISSSQTVFDFSLDLGLRPEWFVTSNFSIHLQVGVMILVRADDDNDDGDLVRVNFFSMGDLLGTAGFTYYF
ncbi:MAG: outer membrane beta-barrel protein [Bradymonadales bacterium]|jgi:hypothetical protein